MIINNATYRGCPSSQVVRKFVAREELNGSKEGRTEVSVEEVVSEEIISAAVGEQEVNQPSQQFQTFIVIA